MNRTLLTGLALVAAGATTLQAQTVVPTVSGVSVVGNGGTGVYLPYSGGVYNSGYGGIPWNGGGTVIQSGALAPSVSSYYQPASNYYVPASSGYYPSGSLYGTTYSNPNNVYSNPSNTYTNPNNTYYNNGRRSGRWWR